MQLDCSVMDADVNRDPGRRGLRAARVAHTESELVAAAHALFVEQGYVATTLAQIARRAGLSERTPYVRFGTKSSLFLRVVDRALEGDAGPVDVAHQSRSVTAMTAPTLAQRIDALAELSVGIAERAGSLFEVAAQAEGLEPDLARAAHAGRVATADLAQSFWRGAQADGLLDARADVGTLATATDVLICADTVVHIRRTDGWNAQVHRALIVDTLAALVAST